MIRLPAGVHESGVRDGDSDTVFHNLGDISHHRLLQDLQRRRGGPRGRGGGRGGRGGRRE